MNDRHCDDAPDASISVPGADAWMAGGLTALAAGIWLLRRDDPYLLTLWGVGLVLIGAIAAIVSTGMLLRVWR